ncbi:hypothetical protein LSCM1_04741 [Leishmania martiniquensis]|uniref:Uncharacterized protein n=1 Tax=Leishmania martiniquensis TaxID=1580590 RepID=A0A836H4Q7_9TRYP|nr:hypothetical protein LSCM1_04741 [Leishmania martiniquensis]
MLFIIVNAVLSAALFIVVVVPLPHIYDPEGGPVGSSGSPIAGEVVLDEGVTPSVRQKLYLLFVIPVCTSVQALFLYFAYYRPLRLIHYRVELNLLALRLTSEARRHQLQKSGVLVLSNRHIVGGGACASSFPVSSAAVVSAHRSGMSAGRGHFDQGSSAAQRLASTVKWGWCRHVRPKSVRKDAWANSAVFAEIGRLRDELELRFLIEGNVTEENLTRAVLKTVDVCTPSTCADVPGQVDDTVAEAAKQNDFYLSSHPPLAALRPTRADLRDAPQNGTTSNGKAAPSPRRDSSALLVPTESYHRNHLRQSAIPASLGGSKLYALRSGLDTSQHVGVHAVADLSPSAGGYSLARHHEPVEMSTSPVEQEGVRTIVHAGTGGIR